MTTMQNVQQVDRGSFTAGYRPVSPWVESYRPADPAAFERTMDLLERGNLREAMHTDDLPVALAGSTDLIVANSFGEIAQPWRTCFTTGPISTFRENKLHAGLYLEVDDEKGGTSLSGRFPLIPEGGRYDEARVGEYYNTIQLGTYGGLVSFTREMLANDDLMMLRDLSTWMGQVMANTLNYYVANALQESASTTVSGLTMADGVRLFATAATRGNMVSSATPLSHANVEAQVALFGAQTDPAGITNDNRGIRPAYLIVPSALRLTAQKIVADAAMITGDATTVTSKNQLSDLQVVVIPDLSSNVDWYLAASPSQVRTVHVGFYQGRETPELFTQAANVDLANDGQRYKIRHDWAVAPVGYWGMRKIDDTT